MQMKETEYYINIDTKTRASTLQLGIDFDDMSIMYKHCKCPSFPEYKVTSQNGIFVIWLH